MERNFIIAGFGGQGVLFVGKVLANAFMLAGKNVTWYPCYGAEMRGGTVNCEIVVSDEEVSSVHKQEADCVVVLNQLSFDRFISKIKQGGMMILNSSLVKESEPRGDINYKSFPMTDKATEMGNYRLANMVSLGVLAAIDKVLNADIIKKAIDMVLPEGRKNLLKSNMDAVMIGMGNALQAC